MTSSTWYRRTLFQFKGNREFTKAGYDAAQGSFNPADLDVSCTDRHYMITGSNSGIGYEVAHHVAKLGGIVHMVCRNEESANKAKEEISKDTGNGNLFVYKLDLSCPRDVFKFAKEFCSSHDQLHVLVNNAGCMVHERKVDDDGIEYNFAVNTLAVHILTLNLIPLLQASSDSRVVTVTSGGMFTVKLDSDDLMFARMDPFNGSLAYSQNKRQQVVMTLCYAQMFDKVRFSCMHPGWADTPAVRSSLPAFYKVMKDKLRTAKEGADTAVWLAISYAAIKHASGLFFQDRAPVSPHLPLAWTRSTPAEEEAFIRRLDDIVNTVMGLGAGLQATNTTREDTSPGQTDSVNVAFQEDAVQKNELASEGGKTAEGEESAISETAVSVTAKGSIDIVEVIDQNVGPRAATTVIPKEGVDVMEVTKHDARADLEGSASVTDMERGVDAEQTKENTSLGSEATTAVTTKELADVVEGGEQQASVDVGPTSTVTVKERVEVVEFSNQGTDALPEVATTVTTKEVVDVVEVAEQNVNLEPGTLAAVVSPEEADDVEAAEQDANFQSRATTAVSAKETLDAVEVTEQSRNLESIISTSTVEEKVEDIEIIQENTSLKPGTAAEEEVNLIEINDENARLESETSITVDSEASKEYARSEPEDNTTVTSEGVTNVAEATEQISSLEPSAAMAVSSEEGDDFEVNEQNVSLEPGTATVQEKVGVQVPEQTTSFEPVAITAASTEERIDVIEVAEETTSLEPVVTTTATTEERIDFIEVAEPTTSLEPVVTTTATTEEKTDVIEVAEPTASVEPVVTTTATTEERTDVIEVVERTTSLEPVVTITASTEETIDGIEVAEQSTSLEPVVTTTATTKERIDVVEGAEETTSLEPVVSTVVTTEEWTDNIKSAQQSDILEPKTTTVDNAVERIDDVKVTEQKTAKEYSEENEE